MSTGIGVTIHPDVSEIDVRDLSDLHGSALVDIQIGRTSILVKDEAVLDALEQAIGEARLALASNLAESVSA